MPPADVVLPSLHLLPPPPRTSPPHAPFGPSRPPIDTLRPRRDPDLHQRGAMPSPLESRVASLSEFVRSAGGIVLAKDARRAGFSERTVAASVATSVVTRVRRRWLAHPNVDPALVGAARAGVVLTCVTAAERLGLWVLEPGGIHVAAPAHAGRINPPATARVHRAAPIVPRPPGELVDPIENVLALTAACLPFEQALAVWESALNKRLVTVYALDRLPFRGPARELIAVADPLSDSGLETFVPVRLRWLGERIVPQAVILGRRVDFLIGQRLVLQIDGGHHVDAQREADIRHDAQLVLNGFHVIRVGYHQVVHDWPSVQHDITRAIAQGLHRQR